MSDDLDPDDWSAFRASSHQALDRMIDFLQTTRERPVWRDAPAEVRQKFCAPLPRGPRAFADALNDFEANIKPYAVGNTHPLFMGWVHGAGTPVGMIAEMLAAGLNANCGGRNHIGIAVERQIAQWAAELFEFPQSASGIFVTGSSAANFLGLLVARDAAMGHEIRRTGFSASGEQLIAYASAEAHGCVAQAMELAGVGSAHLRSIPVDSAGAMRVDLLQAAIDDDLSAGLSPFLVVGTAGTVNTGAIDPLQSLALTATKYGLWFHVDGAFGALAALSPSLRPKLSGVELADSIALDFHKWAHVPYDAGFLLVRDGQMHRGTFANAAAYLQRAPRGLAAGEVWPCDLGPDLSRGFRALKTWFTFQVHGADKIGRAIEANCENARHLAESLARSNVFELRAAVSLNIVCFALKAGWRDEANEALVIDLQERGVAAPSMTHLSGRPVIRAAIVNHRTKRADVDDFVAALHESAARITP
ncbi:aminotransferase class V-fold PLP-dependent enzyme [Methylocapsa sp. S129]|uniref:pyridoxal phosphate-dependent decarboxylase family protein n=1 Tax=Methylocapsa sp. S129 TaxID=1641869 RepID=UPI00131DC9EC|nr:aminotransferase class V-fold PLP-dependent enzyme [Methylocapsa sp. S129]